MDLFLSTLRCIRPRSWLVDCVLLLYSHMLFNFLLLILLIALKLFGFFFLSGHCVFVHVYSYSAGHHCVFYLQSTLPCLSWLYMEKAWLFQSHNSKFYLFQISALPWASWNHRLPFCSSGTGYLARVHPVGQLWLRVSGPHLLVHCCTLSSQVHAQSGMSRIHFTLLLSITPMLGACGFCMIDLQHKYL